MLWRSSDEPAGPGVRRVTDRCEIGGTGDMFVGVLHERLGSLLGCSGNNPGFRTRFEDDVDGAHRLPR